MPLSLFLFIFLMQTTKNKRPLSPHLQIYRLPLVSILSITHRFTGVILSLCFLVLLWTLSLHILISSVSLTSILHFFATSLIFNVIFALVSSSFWFSITYHLLNGIRHMLWDIGIGLSLKSVHVTNLIVLFGSIFLTVICLYWQFSILSSFATI